MLLAYDNRINLYNAAPLGVAGLLVATSFFGDEEGPVFCVFRRCTGGYCPGCGGSRSIAALIRGDIAAAWTLHPWAVLIVGQLLALAAIAFTRLRPTVSSWVLPLLITNLIVGVVLWVTRLMSGSIPVPFA